ncbi:MAG: hypothetical protein WCJ51_00765 [Candidatus Moraniibacteriota bacterium]
MNKQINTVVAIAVISIVAGIIGGVIYFGEVNKNQSVVTSNKNIKQLANSSKAAQGSDTFLFGRDRGIYEMNMATKEATLYKKPTVDLANFIGLPKEIKNKDVSISNVVILLSQDKSKAIVGSATFDETAEPGGFDGSLPTLKNEEFVCDIAMKKCSPTDFLASAYKATGSAYGNNRGTNWSGITGVYWAGWDSIKNSLYGYLAGDGIGIGASPVYKFDLNKHILYKTVGYGNPMMNQGGIVAVVPTGAFSPSFDKFVMIDKSTLLIYSSDNLSAPLKEINLSAMSGAIPPTLVVWSEDEKMLVLGNEKQIYTVNLDNKEVSLKYTDTTVWEKSGNAYWLKEDFLLSSNGRYIIFIEYDPKNLETYPSGEQGAGIILKAIDLQDGNKVIELLREVDDISLNLFSRWM